MALFLCSFIALSLTTWCLGRSIPGLGIGVFTTGVLVLFFFAPLIFSKKKLYLEHKSLWLAFIAIHFILINFWNENRFTGDFLFHLVFSFLFFLLFINLIGHVQQYQSFIFVLLACTTLLLVYLVYTHLFVYKSTFLGPNLNYSEWWYTGKNKKNTLSFFLCLVFPFVYSYFVNKKSTFSTFSSLLIGFAVLYTISRMALIGIFSALLLFCIFSIRKKAFVKHFMAILALFLLLNISLGIGLKTYLKLKYTVEKVAVEKGEKKLLELKGHRYKLLNFAINGFLERPLFGNGIATFRGQTATGGSMTHNDYAQLIYELGLTGILLFLSLFYVSLKDLLLVKKKVPERYQWLWNGQIVSLMTMALMLLFNNAYHTVIVWFVFAGCQIVKKVFLNNTDRPLEILPLPKAA